MNNFIKQYNTNDKLSLEELHLCEKFLRQYVYGDGTKFVKIVQQIEEMGEERNKSNGIL